MSREQVAMDLLALLRRCERAIEDYAIDLGIRYDFGEESSFHPHLDLTGGTAACRRADLRGSITMPVAGEVAVDNDIVLRVGLEFTRTGCSIDSAIEAHLNTPMGERQPGSYILYQRSDRGLSFSDLAQTVEEHFAMLRGAPDFPDSLGIPRTDR
ncbi:hypothetical protein [Micromonospora schwarzwaldensis]|uniref:hypothetical protein n=1 Tax=Micromonospora sp. DSM 45708 TaxID=3111767 RepID=UPI0031DF2798